MFGKQNEDYTKGIKSVLQRNAYQNHLQVREKVFAIALFCKECCQMSDFVKDQSDLAQMLTNITPHLLAMAKHLFMETYSTSKITNLPWTNDEQMITFREKSCIISWKKCK